MIEAAGPSEPRRGAGVPRVHAGDERGSAPGPSGSDTLTGAVPVSSGSDSFAGTVPEKEWTILAYLDGSNELREYLTGNLKEMESVGSTGKTDVAVYLSRDHRSFNMRNIPYKLSEMGKHREARVDPDWRGSRVFHMEKGGSALIEDRGRERVRDPETLQHFIEMGMRKYPAKHYLVVLSGHGNGFRGMLTDRDGVDMPISGVRDALEEAQKSTGKTIDVLAFESCKMGQLEVAYELKDAARLLVASPGDIYNEAFNYETILGKVDEAQKSGAPLAPEDMAKILVESTDGMPDEVPTLTALDLKKMSAVKEALDGLAVAMKSSGISQSVVERLIFDSPQYDASRHSGRTRPERELVDIIGFCNRLVKSAKVTDPKVKEAAAALRKSIDEATVAKRVHEGDYSDQGLSAYIPTARGILHPIDPDYTDLRISADGAWDDFLMGGRKDRLRALTRYIAEKLGIRS